LGRLTEIDDVFRRRGHAGDGGHWSRRADGRAKKPKGTAKENGGDEHDRDPTENGEDDPEGGIAASRRGREVFVVLEA
jgi:hypothetical protein